MTTVYTILRSKLMRLALATISFIPGVAGQLEAQAAYDVVVYGATPGGVCAAIAAAREGAKVALVEPSTVIGGVNTGGLAHSDSNQMVRTALKGLFEEFHLRMEQDYAKRGIKLDYVVAEKDQKRWTYEPHVAQRITDAMLQESGVATFSEEPLQSVSLDQGALRSLTTSKGTVYAGRVFIDGTYEGDLMAAAGVSWTIGREGRQEYGESLAGRQYPKAPMAISGYDADGKLLPLITGVETGSPEDGDKNVMTYSFRLCVTKNPENRVPFPEPKRYDPARFEAVRRYFQQEKKPVLLWDLYALPNEKFDANNGIGKQFSMGLIGAATSWSEADQAQRQVIWEQHKQYTLEMYRFLTTDSAVPDNLRTQLAEYGLCKDEFARYAHWSPQLYVREGRRMRGAYVLTQADILTNPHKPDSVHVASFPIDSHDCQRLVRSNGEVINEGTIFPVHVPGTRYGPPYQVPYRSIIPQRGECSNLLVPVALSATHVAYSSIRVEPSWMALGQSAGVAAAVAARLDQAVHDVDYNVLKARLLAQGQVVDLP